jgi:CheY-like chemotaxis protein
MGMPESMRERLFHKFSQIDSSVTRRFGGTGLGLAISKQLVELMGGTIGVTSHIGTGSLFWFEIPLERSQAAVIDRAHLPEHFKALRTLIVDDLPMNIDILGRQLTAFGMKVQGVSDGFGAIAELERAWAAGKPYDLVFTDHMMPGISGDAFVRRLRLQPHLAETKVIMVSSAGRHSIPNPEDLRLEAILEKPIRHQELLDNLINIYSHAQPAAPYRPQPQAANTALKMHTRALSILLAEDNKINQKFAMALLGKAGHHVQVANNGHEAVDAVRAADFDVILMDIQMPELDGVKATQEIRALPAPKNRVPIIAMTAHAMPGAREEYIAAGMDDYVSKPIDTALLFEKLDRLCNGRSGVTPFLKRPRKSKNDVLDSDALMRLFDIMSAQQIDEIIREFLVECPRQLATIQQAIMESDWATVQREGHTLTGSAGNIGMTALGSVARDLVNALRENDLRDVPRLVQELAIQGAVTTAALAAWRTAEVDPRLRSLG